MKKLDDAEIVGLGCCVGIIIIPIIILLLFLFLDVQLGGPFVNVKFPLTSVLVGTFVTSIFLNFTRSNLRRDLFTR